MAACGCRLLDLVADGLHEMGLAHTDAAVEEERVVGLRGTLRDRLAGGVGKLIAAADDEGVEGVAWVQLCRAVPIETRLRGLSDGNRREHERPPSWRTGVAAGSSLGCHELHVLVLEAEIVDGLLNQVGVLVAHVAELCRGHAHEEHASAGVTVAGGLQPGVVGVAVDLFFQRVKDAQPRIRSKSWTRNGHKKFLDGAPLKQAV